jgi:hypothetical protein
VTGELEAENERLRALLARRGIDPDAEENREDYYRRIFAYQAQARALGRSIGTGGHGWRPAPYGFVRATEYLYPPTGRPRAREDSWRCHHMHAGDFEAMECALAEARRLAAGGRYEPCSNGPECPHEECRPGLEKTCRQSQGGSLMFIAVVNESTQVSDSDVYTMTLAVDRQLRHHAAPAWGLIPPVVAFTKSAPTTPGSVVLYVLDNSDQADALGYHTEEVGGVVYGRVFAEPVLTNGGNALTDALSVASVLSHECCETLLDPACDLWADGGSGTCYAREACDAVESDSYPISIGLGSSAVAVMVSDFLLPLWFDPLCAAGSRLDYMGLCTEPFQVRPTGYTVTMTDGNVSQVFGEHYPEWRKVTKQTPIARTARRLKQGTLSVETVTGTTNA